MKYLHVMLANEGMTFRFIDALYNYLPEESFKEHRFLITDNINNVLRLCPMLLKFDECIYYPICKDAKKMPKMIAGFMLDLFKTAEVIVWHSLETMNNYYIAKNASRKDIVSKSAWVTMMGDRNSTSPKGKKGIQKRFAQQKRFFMQNVPYVNMSSPWSRDNFIKDFGEKQIASFPYPIPQSQFDEMDKYPPSGSGELLNVWLGYNGRKGNNHEKLVACFNKFVGKDIRFVFPMNFSLRGDWGVTQDFKYRALVTNNTLAKFGKNSAIRLRRRNVPEEEYFNTLKIADIGVFWDYRPVSIDVIYHLLYMGKKVFIRASNLLGGKLSQLGLPIYSLSDISKMTFEELAAPAEVDIARRWLINSVLEKNAARRWADWLEKILAKEETGSDFDVFSSDNEVLEEPAYDPEALSDDNIGSNAYGDNEEDINDNE